MGVGVSCHLLANVVRVGSGVLEKETRHWLGRVSRMEGFSALGGTPKAQKVVVVLEFFIVGPPVFIKAIGSFFITLTQMALSSSPDRLKSQQFKCRMGFVKTLWILV